MTVLDMCWRLLLCICGKAYVLPGLTGFTRHLQHRHSLCAQCHVWTDEVRLEDKQKLKVVGCCNLRKIWGWGVTWIVMLGEHCPWTMDHWAFLFCGVLQGCSGAFSPLDDTVFLKNLPFTLSTALCIDILMGEFYTDHFLY